MATTSHSLYKANKKTGTAEISLRFCGGKGDGLTVRTGTQLYIQPHRWGTDNKIIIPRLSTSEKKEILIISEKLEGLDRYIINEFNQIDKQSFSKEWLNKLIQDFHYPPQPKASEQQMQFLEYVESFVAAAPNRLNKRDGVNLRPNALQQYKATQKHLRNFVKLSLKMVDVAFIDLNEDFYKRFVHYLQHLNFRQNTVGKHIRILKTMLNDAPQKYRKECDLSKFKVFNVDVDNVYLTEDELTILWETNLSDNPAIEAARDWFLIACWTGSRYSDLNKFIDIVINKDSEFIEMRHQKTATDVSIPIHPIVKSIYEKYNWELPDLVSNQNINPYIKEAVKLAKINDVVLIDRIEGGKRKKYSYQKHELVGTHSGRRSFCTNMYLRKIPIYVIMAVSGHKTEKSFLKYIKIKQKESSELMSKEWENIYYPQANVEINSPEIIQLQEMIETLKNNELKLKSQILDLINEKEKLSNDFLELRKNNIKSLIELRELKEKN